MTYAAYGMTYAAYGMTYAAYGMIYAAYGIFVSNFDNLRLHPKFLPFCSSKNDFLLPL